MADIFRRRELHCSRNLVDLGARCPFKMVKKCGGWKVVTKLLSAIGLAVGLPPAGSATVGGHGMRSSNGRPYRHLTNRNESR